MVYRCELCPGRQCLQEYLTRKLQHFDDDELFFVEQWVTTDRADLKTVVFTKHELINEAVCTIDRLTEHLFIAKSQIFYLKCKKNYLMDHEAVGDR